MTNAGIILEVLFITLIFAADVVCNMCVMKLSYASKNCQHTFIYNLYSFVIQLSPLCGKCCQTYWVGLNGPQGIHN